MDVFEWDHFEKSTGLVKRGIGATASVRTVVRVTAMVLAINEGMRRYRVEVQDLRHEPVGTVEEVISTFRENLAVDREVQPPQGRQLTFGEVLHLFEQTAKAEVRDDVVGWDSSFSTTVGQINETMHDVLAVDRDDRIDRSRPVFMTELIEIFSRIINAESFDAPECNSAHNETSTADEVPTQQTTVHNDGAQMTRKELAAEAIQDLRWMLEGADSADPDGLATTPLWAMDDKHDGNRPSVIELTERPWESDTAHQVIMSERDADR